MKFQIKAAREKAGFSQKELAKIIGVAPSTFNGYESGNHDPKSELLSKIAEVCNVSVDFLLGRESVPPPKLKKSPSADESAPGNELEREAILLFGNLSDEQKDLFFALLRLTAAKNQGLSAADLVSAGEAALKAEHRNQTQ